MTEPITSQQLDDIAPAGSWGIYEYGNDGSITDIAAEVQRLRAEAEQRSEDLASADNPTHLRWGLNDVQWCDDDSVIVMLSGPDLEAYWLELDPERAAVLREDLAGPAEDPAPADDFTGTQPCGHDDYHDPHPWHGRPDLWCPGIGYDDDQDAAIKEQQ